MSGLSATIINKGPLTAKEAEVLRYLCEGYLRPEIALKLHRSIKTVSSHIEHIFQKLNAHSATEVVVIAQQLGLVEISVKESELKWLKTLVLTVLIVTNAVGLQPKRRPPQAPRPAAQHLRREQVA